MFLLCRHCYPSGAQSPEAISHLTDPGRQVTGCIEYSWPGSGRSPAGLASHIKRHGILPEACIATIIWRPIDKKAFQALKTSDTVIMKQARGKVKESFIVYTIGISEDVEAEGNFDKLEEANEDFDILEQA